MDLDEIKPIIRSILLSLGKRATEKEFRSEYFNIEGDFNTVLGKFQMKFYDFMRMLSDVCRVWPQGEDILIERVSTQESRHMDQLSIDRRKKKAKPTGFR